MSELLPNNKVQLDDGRIIDRADVAYRLRLHPDDENVLVDHKGNCYRRNEKGTLRKIRPNIVNGVLIVRKKNDKSEKERID